MIVSGTWRISSDSSKYHGGELTPALSAQEIATNVAKLFTRYKEEKIATAQYFPTTKNQQGWANTIAVHAETYLLSLIPIAGQPGEALLKLDPKEPRKIAMVAAAREYMARVSPDIRKLARTQAGDVFEPGTVEFRILLDLLNTVQP